MLSILDAFQLIPWVIDTLLDKHGLTRGSFKLDDYVGMDIILGVLRDIQDRVGPEKLRHVGTHIVVSALFPPQYDTVEKVLLGLDGIYSLNHSGDVGHYHARTLTDGAIEVRCATPYPAAFERGIIEGIARNTRLVGSRRYTVDFVAASGASDETCTCVVREW